MQLGDICMISIKCSTLVFGPFLAVYKGESELFESYTNIRPDPPSLMFEHVVADGPCRDQAMLDLSMVCINSTPSTPDWLNSQYDMLVVSHIYPDRLRVHANISESVRQVGSTDILQYMYEKGQTTLDQVVVHAPIRKTSV